MNNKPIHCNGCPINIHHEDGERVDNYGCLPYYGQVKQWYIDTGKVWACHENNKSPCVGFLKKLKRDNVPVSINSGTILITENHSIEEIYHDKSTGKTNSPAPTGKRASAH